MNKWDKFFLDMAYLIAKQSKDPSTKVGAVIADECNRVVSVGYNGFPQKIADDDRLNNRELKYDIIVHGEINALVFARRSLENCTLYTVPFLPCSRCASIMIQAGIKRVVAPLNTVERWEKNLSLSRQLFAEAKVEYIECKSDM